MINKTVSIKNKAGIHCRPSSVILSAIEKYPGNEFLLKSSKGETQLNSILALLSMGLQFGDEVTVEVNGPDEIAACEEIAELFAYEFDFPQQNN